ncbi:terminase small subunit [Variovorax boronicumulans]|uniref:terminase small subunit n=1 Tax=Variovorax boronicumulans TaxID=436515 RepID=UPI002780EC5F|nr:terminase small subunit [Variovorax boronicumulans]MDQ0040828.1 phage terminase small subunit [Variovorax boronicumulans]
MPRGGARPGAGRKPSKPKAEKAPKVDKDGFKTDESWPFRQVRPPEPPPPADLSALTPLDYLLEVMRDDQEDRSRRMQAASLAAPYCHSKKGEGGKKEERSEAAKRVAGRFAPAAPPKLVAAGGKKV